MKVLLTALLVGLLASCSSFNGDAPPLQGTVLGTNAEAETLFSNAKGWESIGENKKAIKSYRKLINNYPADKRVAESRFQIAALLATLGEQRESFTAYQVFIERHPDDRLYPEAVARQEAVANAAAKGDIRNSFHDDQIALGSKNNRGDVR